MKDISNVALAGIVVPTAGSAREDRARLERARKINETREEKAPYILSGIGPDLNEWLQGGRTRRSDWDVHDELYGAAVFYARIEKAPFGMDIISVNTKENLKNSFPKEQMGSYAIVSFPGHLSRMKIMEKEMRGAGELSGGLELHYVPTKSFWSVRRRTMR